MPKLNSSNSGYARIVEAEEEEEEYLDDDLDHDGDQHQLSTLSTSSPSFSPIQSRRLPRMHSYQGTRSNGALQEHKSGGPRGRDRSHSTVDIKAINLRLEKWADEIASKFKIRRVKGKSLQEEKLEIHHSVFQAPDGIRPADGDTLGHYKEEGDARITKIQFDDIVESVRVAIEAGTHPKLIAKGSSGSYFARNSAGTVLGVFKPKDEEPYATKNPKWIKWLHRNFFPWGFGRACLIPNLSYVSEAAAYVLDARLHTNIVPYTDVVYLTSPAFHYDYWERRGFYRKHKPLPPKAGSFQVFLKGYKDATLFLRDHPWPDQARATLRTPAESKKHQRRWGESCRPGHEDSGDDEEVEQLMGGRSRSRRGRFWTETLQQSFREQLEKLVILDYIMRNTDRGLDNWMIRIDEETQQAQLIAEPPRSLEGLAGEHDAHEPKAEEQMSTQGTNTSTRPRSHVRLGAIDNSLSWPWKHPDQWRSYPFGWLFLPVSLIGQPFSEKTRQHFLPLLTSKQWWSDTQLALRKCFMQDADFQEKMFARQIAVMKGQAWNVVETLKTNDHGPLELTRRARVYVWDDLVDIPVAQPMQASSMETPRPPDRYSDRESNGTGPQSLPDANGDLLAPNRFNLPRQSSPVNGERESYEGDLALRLGAAAIPGNGEPRKLSISSSRPSRARLSYDEPRPRKFEDTRHKRGFSFSAQRVIDVLEEDAGGDLGYAAASDQEGNRRKVIVERLETVKSKKPVFDWC